MNVSPLIKLSVNFGDAMENTPIEFNGRTLLALNYRDDTKNGARIDPIANKQVSRHGATGLPQFVARFAFPGPPLPA